MTCMVGMESQKAWRYYMRQATEQEAYDAINQAQRLALRFRTKHEPTSQRMKKLIDEGVAIYEKRFGKAWVPF